MTRGLPKWTSHHNGLAHNPSTPPPTHTKKINSQPAVPDSTPFPIVAKQFRQIRQLSKHVQSGRTSVSIYPKQIPPRLRMVP
ncbi:hypothetical protein CDAR_541091 [Caerostris darwini]|uniref:Uncharacterized protein n=1 Tax=Caerostris darwini TaxID=1538125 RepID=A0AAV4UUK7_9ARAC|nr:hypothetical protein CDAR_541091 [Caerostris darwini]